MFLFFVVSAGLMGGLNKKRLSRKSVWALSITCSNILRLFSTLIVHLYLINISILCPLSRKGPNARHTGAPVAHSSCSWIAFRQYHSSVTRLPHKSFCRQQGVAELDLHGYIRKFIPVQIIRQSSHNGLLTTGLSAVLLTVPVFIWKYFCMLQRTAPSVFIGAHLSF